MITEFEDYRKEKQYLICVDSDGCAMDTMDIKHSQCFGPCMVEEWGLSEWRDPILRSWNESNLYTVTRGINRFKGLSKALREIDEAYQTIKDIDILERWVEESNELSGPALKRAYEETGSMILKKALSWSEKVNKKIDALPLEMKKPFEGVKEALAYAHKQADIAIVSSANHQAVKEEWEQHGLLEYVDILLTQDMGSKTYCIGELMKKGYERSHVMMTGDAPGDFEAAKKNGVFFYPVLVRREKESWKEFKNVAVQRLVDGTFAGKYQKKKVDEFWDNLNLTGSERRLENG